VRVLARPTPRSSSIRSSEAIERKDTKKRFYSFSFIPNSFHTLFFKPHKHYQTWQQSKTALKTQEQPLQKKNPAGK
jgi:hypothetical protein